MSGTAPSLSIALPSAAAPIAPVVIKSKDWVTNKKIKILLLENNCNSAASRGCLIKFEKYLKFNEILWVWLMPYIDRPQMVSGNSQYQEEQWIECDE